MPQKAICLVPWRLPEEGIVLNGSNVSASRAPWLSKASSMTFNLSSSRVILSGHFPLSHDMTNELFRYLGAKLEGEPFLGLDHLALETMVTDQ